MALASCGDRSDADSGESKPQVACTIAMIADVAREVGGDRVEVTNLIHEGVDPHLYKPTSRDLKVLQNADLILYNGLLLEGKMTEALERFSKAGRRVVAVADVLLHEQGYVQDGDDGHHDPHVWMDVAAWKEVTTSIAKALGEALPEHASEFNERARAYQEKLGHLDDYARRSIASIPENQRVLVTAHDAFGYMARAYGIEVRGIQGISTESEAGLKDINELVSFIVERKVPAVFVESSVPRKSVEALVEGTRSRGHKVVIGGELFSDAMGAAGSYEGTYIGMIDHNVTLITRSLGGDAPANGLNGLLP